MDDGDIRELSRLVAGTVALRIVQNGEYFYCEQFEAGKWIRVSPLRVQELFFDKRIHDWFEKNSALLKPEKAGD